MSVLLAGLRRNLGGSRFAFLFLLSSRTLLCRNRNLSNRHALPGGSNKSHHRRSYSTTTRSIMTPKPPVASCPICLDLLTSAVGDSQSTGGGHGAQGCHGLHGCRPGAGLVALLPSCGHKYHQACITTWAERTNSKYLSSSGGITVI